jgi:hypothetical protein
MMTTPAAAIKDEVRVLIDAQIETFGAASTFDTFSTLRISQPLRNNQDALPRTESDQRKKRHGTAVGEGVLAPRVQRHSQNHARQPRPCALDHIVPAVQERKMVNDGGQNYARQQKGHRAIECGSRF